MNVEETVTYVAVSGLETEDGTAVEVMGRRLSKAESESVACLLPMPIQKKMGGIKDVLELPPVFDWSRFLFVPEDIFDRSFVLVSLHFAWGLFRFELFQPGMKIGCRETGKDAPGYERLVPEPLSNPDLTRNRIPYAPKKIDFRGKAVLGESRDVISVLDGPMAGLQLFSHEAAVREAGKVGKKIFSVSDWQRLLKEIEPGKEAEESTFRKSREFIRELGIQKLLDDLRGESVIIHSADRLENGNAVAIKIDAAGFKTGVEIDPGDFGLVFCHKV